MISKFSVKKPYTVLVGVVLAIVLGVVSFTRMTTDLLPSISLPYVIVMTTYPGASPETVEMVVTSPVESGMATVSNIEGITSVSSENYSMVILEFSQSADMNAVSLEIRESLDQIKAYWDDSVGNPIVIKMNPDMLPVMIAAVGVEGMDDAQISTYVQDSVMPEIESLEGVASVSATGLLEESVNVVIRQEKVDALNEKIYAAIDDKMADAEQELADGKQELADGKQEILDGKEELNSGRAEINENKQKLEEGKKELGDKQNATSAQLATQKNQLLAAKTQLETLNSNLTSAKQLQDGIAQIDAGIAQIDEGVAQIDAGIAQIDAGIAQIDTTLTALSGFAGMATTYSDALTLLATANATLAVTPEDEAALTTKTAAEQTIAALNASVVENELLRQAIAANETLAAVLPLDILADLDWTDSANAATVGQALGTVEVGVVPGMKTELETQKAALTTQKAELQKQRNELAGKKTELVAQRENFAEALNAQTSGLGYDAYVNSINEALKKQNITDLSKAIADINNGLIELEKGQLTAAVEFANGKATLALGEYQLSLAEGQLDTAEEQLQSGLDQLQDAEEQMKDGEEQLAEAKEDAYAQADMTEILTVDTIKGLLTAQNFSMPAGYVTEDGVDFLVRVGDKPDSVEALQAMPLMDLHMDGVPVITLGDVADVFYTDNSDAIYTNVNGSAGVMLTIQKQTGYSTGEVSDRLTERFVEMMEENQSLNILTLMDQGIYIDLVMDSIISNILFGAVLAIIILILFLKDLRPTMVVAFSIPISLVTAIVCMYFSGVTLNVISLSGLALGIGMLVDNSIVVIENIYRLRGEGYSMREASIEGAKEVGGAIAASTLTTICVFLPIVFTEGITRQLFVDMGLTIAYSLLASLVIALTVVPAMASKVLTKTKEQKEGKLYSAMMKGYEKLLAGSLRVKPLVFLIVIVLLAGSIAAAMTNGTAFMSEMDSTQLTVSVQMGDEATLAETGEVTDKVVEAILEIEDVEEVGAMSSASTMSLLGGSGGSTNATTIYVVAKEDKTMTNEEIADIILDKTADLEAEISVETSSMDMSALGGSGITIQVQGRDLDTLQQIAAQVAEIVETVEGTCDVQNGLGESSEELRVIIDREKAVEYGLTVAQVFTQISAKLADAGSATTLVTDEKDYSVYVMHGSDIELTRDMVEDIMVDGTGEEGEAVEIALSDIASFENAISPDSINRAGQTRYISVTAAIENGYNVGKVAPQVEDALNNYKLPAGYKLVYSGENEMINDAIEQVLLMLLLALVFMYLIMVAQFQSLLSPFIIMFTIPLAFTGGFMGLFVSGSEVSVIALIGFVMLSGVIVNNGIVIIDYMNQLREEGMELREAILTAGRTRMRPVLMTALTTILALSTMVFSNDMGAEMAKPMSVVTIGGLLYGTLLTLIVIPCVYEVFMGRRERKAAKKVSSQGEVTYTVDETEE